MSEPEKNWWEKEQFSGMNFPKCKMYTADVVAPLKIHPDGENLWNDPPCQPSSCALKAKFRIQEIAAGDSQVFDGEEQLYRERLKCYDEFLKLGRDRVRGVFAAARKEKDLEPGFLVKFLQRTILKRWLHK